MQRNVMEAKVLPFPVRPAGRVAFLSESARLDVDRAQARMPLGYCMMIWLALAVIGWSALGIASRFI